MGYRRDDDAKPLGLDHTTDYRVAREQTVPPDTGAVPMCPTVLPFPKLAAATISVTGDQDKSPHLSTSFFHRIVAVAEATNTPELLDNDIVRSIMRFKWTHSCKQWHKKEVIIHAIRVATASALVLLVVEGGLTNDTGQTYYATLAVCAVLGLVTLRAGCQEFYHLYSLSPANMIRSRRSTNARWRPSATSTRSGM